MGCDIHIVLERRKKSGGAWVGLYSTDEGPGARIRIAQRDYDFFAHVANVRGDGPNFPQNVPEDISQLAWQQYMQSPTDHHSASHMSPESFVASWLAANPAEQRGGVREELATYDLLGVDPDDEYVEYRVVFWFDN